jgi:acetyltransferase-like isoleucine patch superfamily enzyme
MRIVSKVWRNKRIQRVVFAMRTFGVQAIERDLTIGKGTLLGRGVVFETYRALPGMSRIDVGDDCSLEDYVRLEAWGGRISVGSRVFFGPFSIVYGHGGVTIGDDCLIAMHCRIVSSNHSLPPLGTSIRSAADIALPTRIGCDVWLGAGVTVLGGVSVGDGAVIGAGAVVSRDVPPGGIALGVPAKVVGWRRGCPTAASDSEPR